MTDDIKDLLGKAFTQEPPLRIDRDEVLQQGRKRLRRRRVFEASGVVAAVLVVAVGAATLTNLTGDSESNRMPPAASTTESSGPTSETTPPVPEQEASSRATEPLDTTTTTKAPSSNTPVSEQEALALTQALDKSGYLAAYQVLPTAYRYDKPEFQKDTSTTYVYEADLIDRTSGLRGFLQIRIDVAPVEPTSCETVPPQFYGCAIRDGAVIALWKNSDGERHNYASATLSSGIQVTALASNVSTAARKAGQYPDGKLAPVLDDGSLCKLVTYPGFDVR